MLSFSSLRSASDVTIYAMTEPKAAAEMLPPRAFQTMDKLCRDYSFQTILDVGSGDGRHSRYFMERGKDVTAVDLGRSINYATGTACEGDYLEIDFGQQFDAIWCCHVLEHQRNPGLFLDKLFAVSTN